MVNYYMTKQVNNKKERILIKTMDELTKTNEIITDKYNIESKSVSVSMRLSCVSGASFYKLHKYQIVVYGTGVHLD